MIYFSFLFFQLFCTCLFAQYTQDTSAKNPLLISLKTITAQDLKAHLTFLASDALEGRETGERGQKIAAEYLASQFLRMGIQPACLDSAAGTKSFFQTYLLKKATWNTVSLRIKYKKEKIFSHPENFYVFPSNAHDIPVENSVVFAGYGIEDEKYNDFSGLDIKGKIVLIFDGEPKSGNHYFLSQSEEPSSWSTKWDRKFENLREKGAAAILLTIGFERTMAEFRKANEHRLRATVIRYPGNHEMQTQSPVYYVSTEIADEIFSAIKTTSRLMKQKLDNNETASCVISSVRVALLASQNHSDVYAENVVGVLEGTDKKNEVVLLTAHYDHLGMQGTDVYNGADDDGSGTTALLEIAEAFSFAAQNGYRPRRTIVFLPLSGEEKGLLGSRYYTEYPVFPLENTVVDLNIDMIGRIDAEHMESGLHDYVYLIGAGKMSTELQEIYEKANELYTHLTLDEKYNHPDDPNRFYYRSDHYNFAKKNIPVIFFFTGIHEDYHKPTDEIHKINFDKIEKISRLVFATAWMVADQESRIKMNETNPFPPNR